MSLSPRPQKQSIVYGVLTIATHYGASVQDLSFANRANTLKRYWHHVNVSFGNTSHRIHDDSSDYASNQNVKSYWNIDSCVMPWINCVDVIIRRTCLSCLLEMYKVKDKDEYVCEVCLNENREAYVLESIIPMYEADPSDRIARKVNSTLARADPNRNDNEAERKIAERQAKAMMKKHNLHVIKCAYCETRRKGIDI